MLKKQIISLLLVLTFLFSGNVVIPFAFATDSNMPELPDYTSDLYTQQYDQDNPEDNKINNNYELRLSQAIYYTIHADIPIGGPTNSVEDDIIYKIPLPQPLKCYENETGTLNYTIDNNSISATYQLTEDQDFATVQFEGIDNATISGKITIHLSFHCSIDGEAAKDMVDSNGTITINLEKDTNVSITITDMKPKGATLEKTGTVKYGTVDQIDWTITYTAPDENYAGNKPNKLVDTLPQGMALNEDSITVTTNPNDENHKTQTIPVTLDDRDFTYNLDPDTDVTITYTTTMTDEIWANYWANPSTKPTFNNTIKALYGETGVLSKTATVKLSGVKPLLTKKQMMFIMKMVSIS